MHEDTSWVATIRSVENRLIALLEALRDEPTVSRQTRMTWNSRKDACIRLALEIGYRDPETFARWVETISSAIDVACTTVSSTDFTAMRHLFDRRLGMFWGFVPARADVAKTQRNRDLSR